MRNNSPRSYYWTSRLNLNWIGPLLICLLTCNVLADDWPQFLGMNRDSKSAETGLLKSWPAAGPTVLWQKQVGAGFSGPVVAGDRLILFHRLDNQEIVECLNAKSGETQWKHAYPANYRDDFGFDEGPRATPTIADGRVYTLGASGQLRCLELDSGNLVWNRSMLTEYQAQKGFFGVGSSPIIEGDLLLMNVGGKAAGIVGLARDTGKEAWRATSHEAGYASPIVATLQGRRQAVFFTREGIIALDPATGKVGYQKRYRARIQASVNAATPVVLGNSVFVSASYGVGAILLRFDDVGVREVWQSDEVMSNHFSTCVADGESLFGIDGRQEAGANLRCIHWPTGKVAWTREGFGCASIIRADGLLWILSERGDLVLLDPTSGAYTEKARARVLPGVCRAQIALSGGKLYARDTNKLICLKVK